MCESFYTIFTINAGGKEEAIAPSAHKDFLQGILKTAFGKYVTVFLF